MRNHRGPLSVCLCVRGGTTNLVIGLTVGLLALASTARGAQVSDDFNDGNDGPSAPAWTRYDLGAVGAPSTFSFPNGNSYRIQAPKPPAGVGAARAAGYINSLNLSTFSVSADLVDWNTSSTVNQAFGILARLSSVGLQTTNGYALTYAPTGSTLDITRIAGEQIAAQPGRTTVVPALDPAKDYRLVFTGVGDSLNGALYDLTNLSTPVATVSAIDPTYSSGFAGVFVFDNGGTSGTADATFDNFSASDGVPEPTGAAVCGLLALAGLAVRRRN
jgi:hypothetical protein